MNIKYNGWKLNIRIRGKLCLYPLLIFGKPVHHGKAYFVDGYKIIATIRLTEKAPNKMDQRILFDDANTFVPFARPLPYP